MIDAIAWPSRKASIEVDKGRESTFIEFLEKTHSLTIYMHKDLAEKLYFELEVYLREQSQKAEKMI